MSTETEMFDFGDGRELHTFSAWRAMTPEEIARLDRSRATVYDPCLGRLMDRHCKGREAAAREAPNA